MIFRYFEHFLLIRGVLPSNLLLILGHGLIWGVGVVICLDNRILGNVILLINGACHHKQGDLSHNGIRSREAVVSPVNSYYWRSETLSMQ